MNPKSMMPNSTRKRIGATSANSTSEAPSSRRRRTRRTALAITEALPSWRSWRSQSLLHELDIGSAACHVQRPVGDAAVTAGLVVVAVVRRQVERMRAARHRARHLVLDVCRVLLVRDLGGRALECVVRR